MDASCVCTAESLAHAAFDSEPSPAAAIAALLLHHPGLHKQL